MCLFVTVGSVAALEELEKAFDRRHFQLEPANNPSVKALLPPDLATYYVTRGGCSCDLMSDRVGKFHDPNKMRERLKKKGWSQNKIDRAVDQAIGDGSPQFRESQHGREFRKGVVALAQSHAVWLHGAWCGGDPDEFPSEPLTPKDVSLDSVAAEMLPNLEGSLLRVLSSASPQSEGE